MAPQCLLRRILVALANGTRSKTSPYSSRWAVRSHSWRLWRLAPLLAETACDRDFLALGDIIRCEHQVVGRQNSTRPVLGCSHVMCNRVVTLEYLHLCSAAKTWDGIRLDRCAHRSGRRQLLAFEIHCKHQGRKLCLNELNQIRDIRGRDRIVGDMCRDDMGNVRKDLAISQFGFPCLRADRHLFENFKSMTDKDNIASKIFHAVTEVSARPTMIFRMKASGGLDTANSIAKS